MQSKLLRAIESREIERVGGRRTIPVDFRLISATNEDLEARVAAGSFREDLFYRINTIPIRIPPLRERGGDLAPAGRALPEAFCARHGKAAKSAVAGGARAASRPIPGGATCASSSTSSRCSCSFPTATRSAKRTCRASCAPAAGRGGGIARPGFAAAVEDFERTLLSDAIAAAGGVKAEAARRLGLDANQIKYLCRKYGL